MTVTATMTAASYQARQTEAQFMRAVQEFARLHGWLCVHWPNAVYNPAGYPDLTCYRDSICRHIELKTTRGRLGPKQREWAERLHQAGFRVLVATPDDWPEIEAMLQ